MARPGFAKHPKFRRLVSILNIPEAHARGICEMLWEVAYESGNDRIGDATDVELAVGWTGDAGRLADALLTCGGNRAGLIEEIPDDPGAYRIHDLFDHAPEYVQKRMEREAHRTAKGRTLSELRSEAGRKGAEAKWTGQDGKRMASGWQTADACQKPDGKRMANDGKWMANGGTPAPAPAPAPALKSPPTPHATSSQGSSPRASARDPGTGTGPGPPAQILTPEQAGRLDHLRRRVQASAGLRSSWEAIDRGIVRWIQLGAPFPALEKALASLLAHAPRDPTAYLEKVLRVEVPNHHEAEAIAGASKDRMDHAGASGILRAIANRNVDGASG